MTPICLALAMWTAAQAGSGDADALDAARADEIARLAGHAVWIAPDGRDYRITSIAGEGAPLVGRVERAGTRLLLRIVDNPGALVELRGPLAVPRIAGPGYTVWVRGRMSRDGHRRIVEVERLGVLRAPRGRKTDVPVPGHGHGHGQEGGGF